LYFTARGKEVKITANHEGKKILKRKNNLWGVGEKPNN
jgi:hypothetical protein